MWWALQTEGRLEKSVTKNSTKMFWLGYFLRKQMQKENLFKLIAKNKKGDHFMKWAADHEIETYYYNKRLECKRYQENPNSVNLESQRKEA